MSSRQGARANLSCSRRRLIRGRVTSLTLGWAVALSFSGGALGSATAGAPSASSTLLEQLGERAGFEVTILAEPNVPLPPDLRADTETDEAMSLLGEVFDRVEVYEPDGDLQQVVAVGRDGSQGSLAGVPDWATDSERKRIRESFRQASQRQATRRTSSMPLNDALAIARDGSASASERARAIAALAASGSTAAVEALREIALGEGGSFLGNAAVSALGGFADTDAAGAAQAVLADFIENGVGDPVSRAQAMAAYDVAPLLAEFQAAQNSSERRRMVHAARAAAASSEANADFTAFFLAALEDRSTSVRSAATFALARMTQGVDPQAVTAALQQVASSDPFYWVKEAATTALQVRHDPSITVEAPVPDLPPCAPDCGGETGGNTGGESGGGRTGGGGFEAAGES